MRRRPAHVAVAVAVLLIAGLAGARAMPDELRHVLPLLQPPQRAAIEAQLRAWNAWTEPERRAFTRRAHEWDALPVAVRQQRRAAWWAWNRLSDDERLRLRSEATRLATLTPAERMALRAQFDALDLTTQRGWMLGPALGADFPRLQPLLAQAPREDHTDLLRTLRATTPEERGQLAVLVQRTPPQDRERLRRDLVSTSDSNRAAWLQLQLER